MPDPVIFLHVPRTGGVSLRNIMAQVYRNIGRPGRNYAKTIHHQPKLQRCDAWMGHFAFGLHRYLDRPVKYITILRDPAERVLSEYRRRGIAQRQGWSPAEFAMKHPEIGDNVQVRMLADVPPNEPVQMTHVEQAKQNLADHFVFAGVTEHYQTFADVVLRGWLRWNFGPIPHENAAPVQLVGTSGLHHLLEFDYALYRWVAYEGVMAFIYTNTIGDVSYTKARLGRRSGMCCERSCGDEFTALATTEAPTPPSKRT